MCGIAGWFSHQPFQANASRLLSDMQKQLRHRGPDGQGTWLERHVALAHTRLAIIDINQGKQPMMSYDKTIVISFNGEIYNYRELRYELRADQYAFQTFSDTEVIIALYQTHGIEGFNRLRGMFAFALWDKSNNTALLVRDSLGIKPLFYMHNKHELIFASEAKAILSKYPGCAQLNPNHLHYLMNFRYLPGNRTLYHGISQVDPGEILIWKPDNTIKRRKIITESQTTYYPSTLAALSDSVQAHINADVEIGAYLSGGIDSAVICALSKRYYRPDFKTFTLSVGDDPMEADNARKTADYLQLTNLCNDIPTELEKSLPKMIWHLETPKVNALQVYLLAQQTAQHVKVALSGLGADEFFCGYRIHKYLHVCAKVDTFTPRFINQAVGKLLQYLLKSTQKTPFTESQRLAGIFAHIGHWPQVYALFRNIWDHNKLREKIYGPRMLDAKLDNAYDLIEQQWSSTNNPLSATLEFEIQQKLVNDLLWQEDRMSMAHGLEVRVPYVDNYLKASLAEIPLKQHLSYCQLKKQLKKSVSSLLPATIIERKKSGFQLNSVDFFHNYLQPLSKRYLNPEIVNNIGLFNPHFIKQIINSKGGKGLRWHYFLIYLMILTHIWVEQFEQKY